MDSDSIVINPIIRCHYRRVQYITVGNHAACMMVGRAILLFIPMKVNSIQRIKRCMISIDEGFNLISTSSNLIYVLCI